MSRKYKSALLSHSVVVRMTSEDVGSCYQLGFGVGDIRVLQPGASPEPACLWLRLPDKSRLHAVWYWIDDVDGVRKPISTGCRQVDLDGAKAWVLRKWVRDADTARARLAPESIFVCDILDEFVKVIDEQLALGRIKPVTHTSYCWSMRRAAKCYKKARLIEVVRGGVGPLLDWGAKNGLGINSMISTANVLKRAVNTVMERCGSAFRLTYEVGARKPRPKKPFNPDELDRILRVCFEHVVYGEDLEVLTVVDPQTGERVPFRSDLRTQRSHVPFQRAVPMMVDTAVRPEAACEVTWLDAESARLDVDEGVLHRRGEMTDDDPVKRRASCVLSPQFWALATPWLEDDLARGFTHVIHDWRGRPLWTLRREHWIQILKDARVPYRKLYSLKDTAVQISRCEKVTTHDAAERFSITPETMGRHYGADWDMGNQIDPAAAHGAQEKWRRAHALAKERQATAAAARAARGDAFPALPPVRAKRAHVERAGRRPQGTDIRTLKVGSSKPKPTEPPMKPTRKAPDALQ